MKAWLTSWLGLTESDDRGEQDALRGVLDALDQLDPARARYLAQFAYLLGRVAHADQHAGAEETRTMEALVQREGGIPADQAMVVVGLAKTSNRMFGGTDNFVVARQFAELATEEDKLALLRCLFAVSVAEDDISIAEEREIQRISRELRVDPAHLVALRLEHRRHLPGLTGKSRP